MWCQKTKIMKKEQEHTSLYRISLVLNTKGFHWREHEWKCKESKVVYVLTREVEGGEKITRHLQKSDLFKIENHLIPQTHIIEYDMITPFERIEEGKKLLMERAVETATEFKTNIDQLINHINNL